VTTRFRYRASTGRGEVVEGISEAASRQQLLDELRRRDLHAMSIEEVATAVDRRDRVPGRNAAVTRWARNFAALMGAATPLDRALKVSAEQSGHEGLARVLEEVREAVQSGEGLSDALSVHPRWFPPVLPALARAGEASGALGDVLEQAADYLEEVDELRSQVRTALIYPALMSVVAAVGVAVLLLFVVPRFSGILEDLGGSMPLTTRALIATGAFLHGFWWLLLAIVLTSVAGAREWLRRPANRLRWHRSRLGWPVFGDLELKLVTARFTRTLGLLLSHGLPLLAALRIARASVGNLHVGAALERGVSAVAEGHSLSEGVGEALPPLAVEMLAVGEESGRLATMCTRVADTFDKEVRRAVKVAVSLLEPAMIVVFGVLVGLVALAMLQAIYSVNTNLS
jgi:general secretion pathway protein F